MEDFTGITFNYLTGVRDTNKRKSGNTVWVWKCKCGNEIEVRSALVKNGHTKSCGCYRTRDKDVPKICRHCGETSYRRNENGCYASVCGKCFNMQANRSKDYVKVLVNAARVRARKANVPFNLEFSDIIIPETCPILGVKLERGLVKDRDSSPSLDRLVPELGYVKGNVFAISHLANRIKNNGTADEHRRIADWMDAQKEATIA